MSPSRGLTVESLSGIAGSISIACWVVVFSPQIVENFRRHSAEGLSVTFIIIWLLGDVFNILGAVLQGVLPTMLILAVYYTVADVVLLAQCFWYEGFRFWDKSEEEAIVDEEEEHTPDERSSLLGAVPTPPRSPHRIMDAERGSRGSFSSMGSRLSSGVDAVHFSPATPFRPPVKPTATPPAAETLKPRTATKAFLFNLTSLVVVCGVGVLGWWLSTRSSGSYPRGGHHPISEPDDIVADTLSFDLWGQIFGYLCAVLYLGSRVPQLLLNFKRKSTEGVSMLFFLFACVGNLTYVMSIFLYEPPCASLQGLSASGGCGDGEWSKGYSKYILVNLSWLVGSGGTLFLDLAIFIQFFLYRTKSDDRI